MSKIKSAMMLVAGLAIFSVAAEETIVNGINWRYSVTNGTACIEGFANMPASHGKSAEENNRQMVMGKICKKALSVPGKIDKLAVTGIGENAFAMAEGPKSIAIPSSVTSIGKSAFCGNPNLELVSLPPKLTSISDGLFQDCKNLKTIKIPASVKSIGVEAFAGCASINAITVPEGAEDIGKAAFRDCSGLAAVIISANVTNIGELAFVRCRKLSRIVVANNNRVYGNRGEKAVAGALFTRDGTTLVAWPAGNTTASVKIPAGVTRIGDNAFADCPNITSLALPASVTSIGKGAFSNCRWLVIYASKGDVARLKALVSEHDSEVRSGSIRVMERVKERKRTPRRGGGFHS